MDSLHMVNPVLATQKALGAQATGHRARGLSSIRPLTHGNLAVEAKIAAILLEPFERVVVFADCVLS